MMKNILLFVCCLAVISCAGKEAHNELKPLRVQIHDIFFFRTITISYELTDSEIVISQRGFSDGTTDSLLYQRDLTGTELTIIHNFFRTFPLASLKDEYDNPNILDGDRKFFVIELGRLKKTIHITNYYQDDLGNVVDLINGMIPKRLQIYYFDDK